MFGEPFAMLSKAHAEASLQNHVGLGWQATILLELSGNCR
jgi:hypothetical protein